MPNTLVFLSVVQRTSKGSHLDMSLQSFNQRVTFFNQTLAARVKQIRGVYFFRQAINHVNHAPQGYGHCFTQAHKAGEVGGQDEGQMQCTAVILTL